MKYYLSLISLVFFTLHIFAQPTTQYNLRFDSLAKRWDEAIPIGNGWLGGLIWQKENRLRISIDRVDLWDDRPMPGINKLRYKWVEEQVKKGSYDTVQKAGDAPYEDSPAPTKIPGAALEFDMRPLGKVVSNELDIQTGLSVIKFDNGVVFNNYIHAVKEIGYFGFENCRDNIFPEIMVPAYNSGSKGNTGNSVEGQSLERLGYAKGTVTKGSDFVRYHQPTWKDNYYEVLVQWKKSGDRIIGQWTITHNKIAVLSPINLALKEPTGWNSHIAWWKDYWSRSAVSIPDTVLARQYYLEMYKFGCVARDNTPPISLQAIWTADNGNLPPWKGDLHHDLNTELSYWPGYTSNHLDLTSSYTNWLWKVQPENKQWTKQYFAVDGLNVPGVTTISGKAMGGWMQYSMSPTTAGWLAQHFFWQWKYSMNDRFLKEKCLPYFKAVENYFSKLRSVNVATGLYGIPLSSSPEYHNNSINAWFNNFTNYDLSLVKSLDKEYSEIWKKANGKHAASMPLNNHRYPALDTNQTGLTIAPGQDLDESHRHHAHLMAIYPFALLNEDRAADKVIIDKSLRWLEHMGTREWCGYSFSWAACLYANAKQGDSAARMLRVFADNFVSTNSFHLNGDQRGGQYSNFTYRPFTLEGNFAFAQGVQEMLLQSDQGYLEVFPAVPASWKDISFQSLRAEGAFLVSAKKEGGIVTEITIKAETRGVMKLKLPFKTFYIAGKPQKYALNEKVLEMLMHRGETIVIKNGFE